MKHPALDGAKKKNTATEAMVGIFAVVLTTALVCLLYFARLIIVPLALAVLVTFMVSPVVTRIERYTRRFPAIIGVTAVIFLTLVGGAWIISRQALDLATALPNYSSNIERKLQALEMSKDGPLARFSQMIARIESKSVSVATTTPATPHAPAAPVAAVVVPGIDHPMIPGPLSDLRWMLYPFLQILATAGLVMVLVFFMLLNREDLHGRFVKLVGGGRISTSSRAIEDAGARVSRYLLTQLSVNMAFGAIVGVGLYFIGLPNAFLWGSLAGLLRFVPYFGVWIAALGPVALALAISPGWHMATMTFGLFAVIEVVLGNVLEPLIYRSSTGVSPLAFIVAAIFWTWIWGPVGLLLSTPLTVCITVIGRHVPQLSFFSTLLSSEQALTPKEQCYHRLLVGDLNDAIDVASAYMKANSLTALYDDVLVPTVTMAELDYHRQDLDENQQMRVLQGVKDIVEDLRVHPVHEPEAKAASESIPASLPQVMKRECRIVCLPARGARDEIAGSMLVHLLEQDGFDAALGSAGEPVPAVCEWVDEQKPDIVCISVIPPTTLIHAQHLARKLRAHDPKLKIVVGLWGAIESLDQLVAGAQVREATEIVVSMATAVTRFKEFATARVGDVAPAAIPVDEEQRLIALMGLKSYTAKNDPSFDRMTRQLTRTFSVPIALLTLIDRERQIFKSQCGLPDELATVAELPREDTICTHVVAENTVLVVEDLTRDPRFANNPLVKEHQLRFYAGVPLRAPNGQPVGALCIMDTRPRIFSEADQGLLMTLGEEISAGLAAEATEAPAEVKGATNPAGAPQEVHLPK